MRRLGSFLIITLVAVAAPLVVAPRTAWASCHAFSVEINPAYVREGGTVGVTVRRDGGGGSSSVRISSVNESAVAGPDFEAVDRRISLGINQTHSTFPVSINDDSGDEPDESFRLHLSSPTKCAFEPAAPSAGPDARVTIQDNDPTPAPAPAPSSPPTTAASGQRRSTTTTTARSRVARASSSTSPTRRSSSAYDETESTDALETTTTAKPRTAVGGPEITVPTLPPTTAPDRSEAALEVSSTGPNRAGAIAVATLSVLTVLSTGGYGLYRRRSFREPA